MTGQSSDRLQNIHSFKATFIGLSYSYEKRLSQEATVDLELLAGGALGSNILSGSFWMIAPSVRIEPRYYYNYLKRLERGRNVLNNSANYLALAAEYMFGVSLGDNPAAERTLSVVPKWGSRRALGDHFFYEHATGLGFYTSETKNFKLFLGADLKIGYAF